MVSDKKNNEISLTSIIKTLQQDPKSRTDADILTLVSKLQESRFFKDMNYKNDILFRLAQSAGYKFHQKMDFIFEQDDEADNFYLILQGEV